MEATTPTILNQPQGDTTFLMFPFRQNLRLDEHALDFYHKYAKLGGFSARKNTKKTTKSVAVTRKHFVCSKQGLKACSRVDVVADKLAKNKILRRRRPSKRIGCKAFLRLALTQNNKYIVIGFKEEHNHPFVDKDDYLFLTKARKMSVVQQQFMCDLSKMNNGHVKAFNIMRVKYGGFEEVAVTSTDCKNSKSDFDQFIGEFDCDMAVHRLLKKKKYLPDFSCEYLLGVGGALDGLFWADEEMKRNYLTFGDVVSFDATFRTNKYKMVFIPFTGIDNHHRNVTFAGALLNNEKGESYIWLLEQLQDCFGVPPKVIVTDQDASMVLAIKKKSRCQPSIVHVAHYEENC